MAKQTENKSTRPEQTRDAIRVVPLYHPRSEGNVVEPQSRKGESELYNKKSAGGAVSPKLVYGGGSLIQNVNVFTIFWGKNWQSDPNTAALKDQINQFFSSILSSSLMDQLSEYSTEAYKIGHGSLAGTIVITQGAPAASIEDAAIQKALQGWISAKTIPEWKADTLYFIYMDKGVKVEMGGEASCTSFCGYHDAINGETLYAVMPYPNCTGCLGGLSAFDALTATSTHELCEAITDPVPPTGWYDNKNGEIGDICAWKFKKVNGYNVQLEWSNKASQCQ